VLCGVSWVLVVNFAGAGSKFSSILTFEIAVNTTSTRRIGYGGLFATVANVAGTVATVENFAGAAGSYVGPFQQVFVCVCVSVCLYVCVCVCLCMSRQADTV